MEIVTSYDEGQLFVSEIYDFGWVYDFDWMTWLETEDGKRLATHPEAIGSAFAEELRKLLTAIIRSENRPAFVSRRTREAVKRRVTRQLGSAVADRLMP